MNQYYVVFNGGAWIVKEAKFFVSQGGLTQEWGKAWKPIYADSLEHARLKAMADAIGGEHELRRMALRAAC